jgi:flagellar basal-body rod protein FlgG
MIKGITTTEQAMRPKLARMETLANNLANINSTGFKKDKLFVQMLNESSAGPGQGSDFDGVRVKTYVDFTEGSLEETGNPLDLALQGPGFFAVTTPSGTRYTRAGSFRFDTEGNLVTSDNFPVQGANGAIRLPDNRLNARDGIRVLETGEIMLDKDLLGQLRVVQFATPTDLVKDGQSFFRATPGQVMMEGPGEMTSVRQGFLEESNVEGIDEMMAMIELNRSFETDQKALQSLDATLERSMDVGRV